MKRRNTFRMTTIILAIFVLFVGCNENSHNMLTEKEKSEGWTLLFDGKTLNNWHVYNKGKQASEWSAVNGEIFCNPDSPNRAGDLVTDKEYENYELHFDWKLSDKGNSGVFINVVEGDSLAAGWLTGPEYQLLDNNHKDYSIPTKRAGSLYSFTPQEKDIKMAGPNMWNHSKIIQQNGKVKFYLNGIQTAEMDFLSREWQELVSKSAFARYKLFGKSMKGKIALQDWASGVSFQNIKIKEL